MKYTNHIADLADIFQLNKLVNSAYRGTSSEVGWTTEAALLDGQRIDTDKLAELIEEQAAAILCLKEIETKQITACVHLKKHGSRCYLGMLTVQPDLQNAGLGKVLLELSETQARTWSCDSIFMTVISVRKELIDYYVRRGYQLTGEKQPFPYGNPRFGLPKRQDLEFVVLEKSL